MGALRAYRRPLTLATAFVALMVMGRIVPIGHWLQIGSHTLRQSGPLGAALFIGAYSIGALLFVPAAMFTFVAGFSLGAVGGIAVGIPGIATSSLLVFLLARTLLRNQVETWLSRDRRFVLLDRLVARLGARAVVLLRLSPLSPFSVLNYAFGLTGISKRDFFFATCIGTLPGSIFYAHLGALAPNLARIAEGRLPESGRAQSAMLVAGLVLTAVVALWLGKKARQELLQADSEPEGSVDESSPEP